MVRQTIVRQIAKMISSMEAGSRNGSGFVVIGRGRIERSPDSQVSLGWRSGQVSVRI
jgi:hypothetical protein